MKPKKKRSAGRPPLGPEAITFPLNGRIPQWLGKSLLKRAREADSSIIELVREDLVRGNKRWERKARKGVD